LRARGIRECPLKVSFSEALWVHFGDTVNLLGGDGREFLRDELFEDEEIEELQRCIVWLEARAER
jgi:hypothetical protein